MLVTFETYTICQLTLSTNLHIHASLFLYTLKQHQHLYLGFFSLFLYTQYFKVMPNFASHLSLSNPLFYKMFLFVLVVPTSQACNPGTLGGLYNKLFYPISEILLQIRVPRYKYRLPTFCHQAGSGSVGEWSIGRWSAYNLSKTLCGFWLQSGWLGILFSILWRSARSGLDLPLQPFLSSFMVHTLSDILTPWSFFQFLELP